MKTIKTLIFVCFILLTVNKISAQYGNQYGYGNQNGYGNSTNRGFGNGNSGLNRIEQPSQAPSAEDIEKQRAKNLEILIEKLKTKLELDELQVIAISDVINKSTRTENILMKKETDDAQKTLDMQAIAETTDRKIMEMLNKTQKEKFLYMKNNPEEFSNVDKKKKKTKK